MRSNTGFHRAVRKLGLALCKRFPAARRLRTAYWDRERKSYEKLSAAATTDEHMVIFEAFGGRKYACSPKAIYEAMRSDPRFDGWDLCWSFKEGVVGRIEREGRGSIGLDGRARVVVRGSEEYFDAFARAKYWIQNNRVPEYVVPREDQVYVQCWHGTPLKTLGCDVPESMGGAVNTASELAERFQLDAGKWTWLLSPSPYTSEHLASAFGLSEERRARVVLEEGYPRNDSIVNTLAAPDATARVEAIKGRLGVPQDKKLLLFAPTWRDDQYTEGVGYTLDSLVDFDVLRRELGREWAVLLRTHYYIANTFDLTPWEGFVYNVSAVDDVNDLYCIADALCTDYSSVFFDYADTGRPLLFFWPDLEHYEGELHSFYLDANTLPGPKCRTAEELAAAVDALDGWYNEYGEAYERFRAEFCPKDDGHASERVIERVFVGADGADAGTLRAG